MSDLIPSSVLLAIIQNQSNNVTDEQVVSAVNKYLTDNPVQAYDDSEIKSEIGELKSDLDKLNDGGLVLKDEVIEEDINNWLNEHPEATTTVQDHSLTINKLVNGTLGYVTPEMFGAKGNGIDDDSEYVLLAMSSRKPIYFENDYLITIPYHAPFYTFTDEKVKISCSAKSNIVMRRNNSSVYDDTGLESFICLDNCVDSTIELNITGDYNVVDNIGKYGISAIFINNCENININLNAKYIRYGIRIGNFHQNITSKNIKVSGHGERIGYFTSAYGVIGLNVVCTTNEVHRSVYVAGAENVFIDCSYTCQYSADTNVLFTTDYLNGKHCGVTNAHVIVKDEYHENQPIESKSFGFGCLEGDSLVDGYAYQNIVADIFKVNNGTGVLTLAAPYNVFNNDIATNNIVVNVFDSRDSNSTNRLIRESGDYTGKYSITLTGYSLSTSIMSNSEIKISNGRFALFNGGNVTLENSSASLYQNCKLSIDDCSKIILASGYIPTDFKFKGIKRHIINVRYDSGQFNVYNILNGVSKFYVMTPKYTSLTFMKGATQVVGTGDSCEKFTEVILSEAIAERLKITSTEEIDYLYIIY